MKQKRKKSKRKVKSKKRLSIKIPSQTKDADGNTIIKVSESWANHAYVNDSKYKKKYKQSIHFSSIRQKKALEVFYLMLYCYRYFLQLEKSCFSEEFCKKYALEFLICNNQKIWKILSQMSQNMRIKVA